MNDKVVMSFAGKTHSGNVSVRLCDKSRGEHRVVCTIWRNGAFDGEGDEQQLVVPADLVNSLQRAITVASGEFAKSNTGVTEILLRRDE